MAYNSIEAILKQKLGLDTNSIGSRMIDRAVQQRQSACGIRDRTAYLALLQSSPQELNQLIEAVVIPETWFFRDRGPFKYLQQHVQQLDRQPLTVRPLRLLSVPCSTGEEPYSIAMTLLEAGLTPAQFQIDAVDVSRQALAKAKQAIYNKKSFRGDPLNLIAYFQTTAAGHQVKPIVRQCVQFIHGNILEPHFLVSKQYDMIFCRNLLIYLDEAARQRAITSLDQALAPQGLLFLGAVETPQLANRAFTLVAYPSAFAFQKQPAPNHSRPLTHHPPTDQTSVAQSSPILKRPSTPQPSRNPAIQSPLPVDLPNPPTSPQSPPFNSPDGHLRKGDLGGQQDPGSQPEGQPTPLAIAQQLADRGQLAAAAQICESYLRAHPAQAPAYLLLGEIYQGLNQLKPAEQSFQKAVYLKPDSYEALIHLALIKEQQGQQAESERFRKRAQRLVNSDYPQAQAGR
jgi:chemotaxis protein methyltransferase WspC